MLGKKWIPSYQRDIVEHEQPAWAEMTEVEEVDEKTALKKKRKEELSTKGQAFVTYPFDHSLTSLVQSWPTWWSPSLEPRISRVALILGTSA